MLPFSSHRALKRFFYKYLLPLFKTNKWPCYLPTLDQLQLLEPIPGASARLAHEGQGQRKAQVPQGNKLMHQLEKEMET